MTATSKQPTQQTTTAQRVRAISRELSKKQKAKWERIESAVRRLNALADDIDAGVEGLAQ